MSPHHFREFVQPYLKRSVDAAHGAGVPYIKHTDGNIWLLFDALVETGIDAIDPLEPLADMDIGRVKQQYGDRLAMVGNIDCTELLPRATPADVSEAVKETVAKAAPDGGYILASSNSIHPGVNPENYRAMVEAARRWGQYPIDPSMADAYRNKNYIEQWIPATS
jgi:uroporphyrinogen decarboxylase